MDKILAKKLGVFAGASKIKTLADGEEIPFAFVPNNGEPLLAISLKPVDPKKLVSKIQKEATQPDVSICYAGQIRQNADKKAVLHLDPDKCKGATSETMLLKGVRSLGKELKISALKGAVLPSLETSDTVKTGKHLVEKGTFARINSDIGKLAEVTDETELLRRMDKLVRHMKDWQDEHDDASSDGAKAQAKRAKIAELEANLWPKLHALLSQSDNPQLPSQEALDYFHRMVNADVDGLTPYVPDDAPALQRAERWVKLINTNALNAKLAGKREEMSRHRHQEARKGQALRAREELTETRSLRHELEAGERNLDDALARRFESSIIGLLDTSASDESGRITSALKQLDHLQKKARKDKDQGARDRLQRLERNLRAQKHINDNPGAFQAIESEGRSGSYAITNKDGEKSLVFKPMHQEFHTEYESPKFKGDLSGSNTRGEVMGYEVSRVLEKKLGIAINAPKTQLARLNAPGVGAFDKFEGRSLSHGDTAQLGSMQDYVQGVQGSPNEWRKVRHRDLNWLCGSAQLGSHQLKAHILGQMKQNTDRLEVYLKNRFPEYEGLDETGKEGCWGEVLKEATETGEFFWDVPDDVDPDAMSEQVQRIAVLDLVSLQSDRNDGNLLLQKTDGGDLNIIPIDQGDCFPDLDHLTNQLGLGGAFAAWQKLPFNDKPIVDPLKTSLLSLDPEEMAQTSLDLSVKLAAESGGQLKPLNAEQLGLQRLSARVLQAGVRQDLSVKEIAGLYQFDRSEGEKPDAPSPMLKILAEIKKSKSEGLLQLCLARQADPRFQAKLAELKQEKARELEANTKNRDNATNQVRKNNLQRKIDELTPLRDEELLGYYGQDSWMEAFLPETEVEQLMMDVLDSTELDRLVAKHVP